jgi:hypothetical protein
MTTADPLTQRVEFSLGEATCELTPAAVSEILAAFVTA